MFFDPATSSCKRCSWPSCINQTPNAVASLREPDSSPFSPPLPKCLFNSTMRIPKKPVSFCLSLFSPEFSTPPLSSWIPLRSGKRRGFRNTGASQLHASYPMDESLGTIVGDKSSNFHVSIGDGGHKPCIWSSPEGGRKIDIGKHIFCNRSLNMKNIVAVGFDMDYTLAQYKPETFESLAYEGTIKKLVHDLGYPCELLDWSFDWKYMVRGLVLDKKRGNILKMDRHKYVKVAYHGFKELSKEEKVGTYGNTLIRDSFDEPDYALIDTLFSLAEAYLFAQLVDFRDNNPGKVPEGVDYSRMYKDVRAAVDLCHRDGTLKQMVAKDPKHYINEDTSIVPMLKMLRDSGRSTFLVTNSLWDYTNIVMNFLCESRTMNGSNKCNFDWLQYFDVVITGSAKPGFFHEDNRANLFEVEPESGMLLNTDNGSPMPQVGSTSLRLSLKGQNKTCRVFQGGSVGHLHKLLSIESSSQVLYVGDHIYGDILRSKKVLGWRTMLVVPELEREVELLWELRDTRKELRLMRNQRDNIEDQIHRLKWSLKFEDVNVNEKQKLSSALNELESQREPVRLTHQLAQRECHQKFHKVWGQLMKTGYQNSRFAHQVERFACLYTGQVSNLSLYSPDKYYRPSEDFMPHEFDIIPM
ncbi:5'-nucleotidase domain-containing protein 4-like isoform X1 [Juglans microcarpa x Juglans regia]|uniref:5'-nucleotidase domain-containing protein 4-like isoform X1 n=2 Tax=Juglans microcarpa x Juglans regia TaxID=2249226 RepID=UPI001B7F6698|nr:5'-nucleotidase domain-containing protein 4-like isoform X1 [Juglans microcarpa x Juglans regia]